MASIRERPRVDGSVAYTVIYRQRGKQRSVAYATRDAAERAARAIAAGKSPPPEFAPTRWPLNAPDIIDAPPGGPGVYLCRGGASGKEILYIGATSALFSRLGDHQASAPWWPQVAYVEWQGLPSRAEADRLERKMIQALDPIHNKVGRRID